MFKNQLNQKFKLIVMKMPFELEMWMLQMLPYLEQQINMKVVEIQTWDFSLKKTLIPYTTRNLIIYDHPFTIEDNNCCN